MALSKRRRLEAEKILCDMLDSQDADVVVVRGSECQVLFMNTSAYQRLDPAVQEDGNCKTGFSRLLPGMCAQCPGLEESDVVGRTTQIDLQDLDDKIFRTSCATIQWLDGKPATVWFLRDVSATRTSEDRLFSLAYIDQLTGAPNRQKFKEDYEALRTRIENNQLAGAVAIFDLDNFKNVNDSYGHNTGDIMLRRLAEHLGGEPIFKDHVYRLGGDEFVLFFSEPKRAGEPEETFIKRYEELLSGALLSYTLPNIDVACTITMGVAFFPKHGFTVSELLRKADIALYKAKASGRNQLTIFEDKYDNAKKLKDMYINIQPILTRQGVTFGYELLDQGENDNLEEGEALRLSGIDRATDALGLDEIQNNERYFIYYTKQLQSESVRKNLPKDKFIIQVKLPNTLKQDQLAAYKKLKDYGYSLAMTNIKPANASGAMFELAEYCKFAPFGMEAQMQQKLINIYKKKTFIATDVNTPALFEEAKAQGFKLFQGFFFDKPIVTKKTKEIDPMKVNYFRLLKMTSTEDYVDFQEISSIIASDVALSYKLLRLLNSAALGLRYRVSSIPMAVAYLGEENLKKWIALLALRGAAADKPLELIRMSLIRAQFGELLAPHFRPRRNSKHVFLVGMFSLLHIALDKSKEELLDEMPVADEIRESLLTKNGLYSDLVAFYSNYEYANWEEVNRFAQDNQLGCQLINECYVSAVKWYNDLDDSR